MKHQGTKYMETARLILRPFTMDDADAMFHNWASDPEVTKFMTWPAHTSVEVSRMVLSDWTSHYAEENYYQWAIVPKELGQPIGSIAAVHMNDRLGKVEIGYCIGRAWWHQGIMTEAVKAVIGYFLMEVGANRVEATHDPNNPNSGKVMAKCGMQFEGIQRQAGSNNQGLCDLSWYAVLASEWKDKRYNTIASRTPIEKGWSGDQKYRVTTADGSKYLLRVSPTEKLERRKSEFARMQLVEELEIPMCRPVEFGLCNEGVYSLQSWVDGADAESVLPFMPPHQQYAYGLDAGRILAKIHSIPAPDDMPDWESRFNAKIDRKISQYESCPLKYEKGEAMLQYLRDNRQLLKDRNQSYQHGDYHIGNMMIDRSGKLVIIDFDKDDFGDPWEEFNRIVWSAQAAPRFAAGMVDGYFDGKVPMAFWNLLALYICSNTIGSLPWAVPFGEGEVAVMRKQAANVLHWYDNMRCTVPTWYQKP